MKNNVKALTRFFAAINRNDMPAIIEDFDPIIVRVEPDGFPTAGTYCGVTEVQEHVRKGRGTWAEGPANPSSFLLTETRLSRTSMFGFAYTAGPTGLAGDLPMALYFAKAKLRNTVASASEWTR